MQRCTSSTTGRIVVSTTATATAAAEGSATDAASRSQGTAAATAAAIEALATIARSRSMAPTAASAALSGRNTYVTSRPARAANRLTARSCVDTSGGYADRACTATATAGTRRRAISCTTTTTPSLDEGTESGGTTRITICVGRRNRRSRSRYCHGLIRTDIASGE